MEQKTHHNTDKGLGDACEDTALHSLLSPRGLPCCVIVAGVVFCRTGRLEQPEPSGVRPWGYQQSLPLERGVAFPLPAQSGKENYS